MGQDVGFEGVPCHGCQVAEGVDGTLLSAWARDGGAQSGVSGHGIFLTQQ